MREKGERNHYLDFVKGVAIILVVFGHSLQYGSGKVFYRRTLLGKSDHEIDLQPTYAVICRN